MRAGLTRPVCLASRVSEDLTTLRRRFYRLGQLSGSRFVAKTRSGRESRSPYLRSSSLTNLTPLSLCPARGGFTSLILSRAP
jgi:hypothetical protein